jgi:hypothetical protein
MATRQIIESRAGDWTAGLMGLVAASLAVMSGLHLGGVIEGGDKPYQASSAGIAEAVICVVLVAGAFGLWRSRSRAYAIAATVFAIIGFLVGLTFTLQGGKAVDIAYHTTVLPVLVVILALLLRLRGSDQIRGDR